MTASAKPEVQRDIIRTLCLRDPVPVIVPFSFNNLTVSCISAPPGEERLEIILDLAREPEALPMVVFCATKKQCQLVSALLAQHGHNVLSYHAGMPVNYRADICAKFQQATRCILVATSAYEMGVDKANIRTVVHFGMSGSLESYVQGMGRAGRDGKPAKALLLYSESDFDLLDAIAGVAADADNALQDTAAAAQFVYDFATAKRCRLEFLNSYFFPALGASLSSCGLCDNCQARRETLQLQPYPDPFLTTVARALRHWRTDISRERQVAAFTLLTDREIRRLCTANPQSEEDLQRVAGVRRPVVDAFGGNIIQVIRNAGMDTVTVTRSSERLGK